MEEKKNENGGEQRKNRRPRKHGYFIAPPTAEGGEKKQAPASAENTARADNKQNSQGAQSKNNNGANGAQHHRRNDRRSQQDKNAPEQKKPNEAQTKPHNVSAPANGAADQSANAQPQGNNGQKKKNNHHRRGKGHSKPHDNAQTVQNEAATAQKEAPKPQSEPKNVKKPPQQETPKARTNPKDTRFADHSADDYEAYTLVVDDETTATDAQSKADESAKTEVVGIRFKSSGKIYYFDPKGLTLKKGMGAIVDTARGQEFGEVAMGNSLVSSSDIVPPLRPVIRMATTADVEHHKANKQKEDDAFKICCEKINEHKLDMKLIDAQYTFDNSKLLFYFTSNNRVDFRELVKDLASVFRTRIELRQIGIRDEAKIMGGLGMCGRPLCCTLFLSDFDQVSIKMAKEQNLSLNSAKISGICGRLMCCLKYEHEAYEYEIKRTPPVDSLVRTENGDGIVTEISPLQGTIKVKLLATPDVPPKTYKRDDVKMLRKKQS